MTSILLVRPTDLESLLISSDIVCDILDVRAAYDVFLDMHHLEVCGRTPFHPHLVKVIKIFKRPVWDGEECTDDPCAIPRLSPSG